MPDETISIEEFARIDLRIGTILGTEPFPEARKPALKVTVDFGPDLGALRTSAQITDLYEPATLVGRQVVGLVNVPPRQIGPVRSQFLLIGVYREDGEVVLITPDSRAPNGARLA